MRTGAGLVAGILLMMPVGQGASGAPAGQMEALTLPGSSVNYTLSVPGGRAPDAAVALVVSLHYGGPVSPWYGRGLLEGVVEPALRPLGAIMVAPDCPERRWSDGPCETAVLDVIAAVRERFDVDSRRIVLTGYSKGGIGTWALAARHPDVFSAAVIMAGSPPAELDPDAWRVPAQVIQARDDEVLPLAPTEALVARLKRAGAPVELTVLDGVTHYDTGAFAGPLAATLPWLDALWR